VVHTRRKIYSRCHADTGGVLQPSGMNLTLGTRPFFVMPAKATRKRAPRATNTVFAALDRRFRGGDDEAKIGTICLVRTTSCCCYEGCSSGREVPAVGLYLTKALPHQGPIKGRAPRRCTMLEQPS
jgi:hypothetical protein